MRYCKSEQHGLRIGTPDFIEPEGEGWRLSTDTGESRTYRGVVIANDVLIDPNIPDLKGRFSETGPQAL